MIIAPYSKELKECHHSIYYLTGLTKCSEVKEVYCNSVLRGSYDWFTGNNSKVHVTTVQDIESRKDLDFVIYGWAYTQKGTGKGFCSAKSFRITMNMQDSVIFSNYGNHVKFLDTSDLVFKISLTKDREFYYKPEKRFKCWQSEGYQLTKEEAAKLRPLMYVGAYPLDYPAYPFTNRYKVSFTGSKTSADRINVVIKLKDKYGDDFIGGIRSLSWLKKSGGHGEDGIPCGPMDVLEKYRSKSVTKKDHLKLMRDSTVSLSPPGWGRNTHRFVDILCMGGACLVGDISHIDYGPLGPIDGEHYLSYKRGHTDLIDKVEYLLNHKDKAEQMGNKARAYMDKTYIDNTRMAREYILKAIK